MTAPQTDTKPNGPVAAAFLAAGIGSLVLGIFTREPDGYGGSTMGVPGCRITTGSDGAGASWFVSLDRAEPFETEPIPVAEADGSGARSVWLEVAADGTVTGSVGREPPDVEATLDDLCGPVSAP